MRFILTIITFVLFITPSWAGDLNKGLEAVQKGDYETALNEWMPLAEQNNPRTQYLYWSFVLYW